MNGTSADDRLQAALTQLENRLEGTTALSARMARLERETLSLHETVALRSDVMQLGTRVDALSARIGGLSEQLAATAPRIRGVEQAIQEIRVTSVRQTELDGVTRGISDLSARVAAQAQSQVAGTARLSGQLNGWLVTILILVVGAMVSYALLAGTK